MDENRSVGVAPRLRGSDEGSFADPGCETGQHRRTSEEEFATFDERAAFNPYVRLDLDYLRDRGSSNRSFAYVVTYDTFVAPPRDDSGGPSGEPELVSVVKLGDGGREDGRSAGKASGSIICRTVRSYWDEPNLYRTVLRGVAIPGNDRNISAKIAKHLGGWDVRVRGDVWHVHEDA